MEGQNPNIRALMDAIPLPQATKDILDAGSTHKHKCRCDVCRQWWRAMTSRDEMDFGPFTRDEVHGPDPAMQGRPLS